MPVVRARAALTSPRLKRSDVLFIFDYEYKSNAPVKDRGIKCTTPQAYMRPRGYI